MWDYVKGQIVSMMGDAGFSLDGVLHLAWALIANVYNALFDPATWLDWGRRGILWLIDFVDSVLPEDIRVFVQSAKVLLAGDALKRGIDASLWLSSPFVSPTLIVILVKLMATVTVCAWIVRIVIYIKGHFWSSSR